MIGLGELAPASWGIPVVANGAERDALFPLATRKQNQRVFRLDTGIQQRWSGSVWLDDAVSAYNVASLGADALGVATSDAVLAAVIAAAPAGGTIVFPPGGSFRFTQAISVTKSLTFQMSGATLTQVTPGQALFSATGASNITWIGGTLIGPQYTTQSQPERAISVTGTSAASPATTIRIHDVTARQWGGYGIYLQYVSDFSVEDFAITNIWYAGIGVLSSLHGLVTRGRVQAVLGAPDGYGIFFSRNSTTDLVADPRSEDIDCTDIVVRDIPQWEGVDTHGGKNIRFQNISCYNCNTGLAIVPAGNGTTLQAFAPLDCHASDIFVDSQQTDGSRDAGVKFCGAEGTPGATTEYATGSLRNITVCRHGTESSAINGGVYLRDTLGLEVTSVQGIECSPSTVLVYHDNNGLNLSQVTSVDHWTNTRPIAMAVFVNDDYNTGRMEGVSAVRGSKVATLVLDRGIRISTQAHNAFQFGTHDLGACTTPLDDGGNHASYRIRAAATFDQLVTLNGGLKSLADIDATGGWRGADDGFYLNAISANVTTMMTRHATRVAYPTKMICPTAGSITCLWAQLDTGLAGTGNIDVRVYINGVFSGFLLSITVATGAAIQRNATAKDALPFAIGDAIELQVIVSNYSGGPYNLVAGLVREIS